jgi:hypothetical protein
VSLPETLFHNWGTARCRQSIVLTTTLKTAKGLADCVGLVANMPKHLRDLMKEHVQLDGLLFTNDTQVLSVMNQILESFSIDTEVCRELAPALDAVTHRRLDAVIVDWDGEFDPSRIVRATRKSSPNSNSIIVAMVNRNRETHALLVGANFMIHKPADIDQARRCMRAAYGTMIQNRRRAARVAVNIPVVARIAEVGEIEARISDLSVGGLALQCVRPVQANREMLTQFSLPGNSEVIHTTGRIVNADANGRAGVRFSFITEEHRTLLERWLAFELAKLEKAEIPTADGENNNN